MEREKISGYTLEQKAMLKLFRSATQKAAAWAAAGKLLTCDRFRQIVFDIRSLADFRVLQCSFFETPDEFPFVDIWVACQNTFYRCSFFLFPLEEGGTSPYLPVRLDVSVISHPERYPFMGFQ